MNEEIKDLTLLFTDALLILQECRELKANLSCELQAASDDRRAQREEFRAFMRGLWAFLDKLATKHLIQAQLLDLIKPQAGEKENETSFMARFTK